MANGPSKEKSSKTGDFSLFICIYAKKSVSLQPIYVRKDKDGLEWLINAR